MQSRGIEIFKQQMLQSDTRFTMKTKRSMVIGQRGVVATSQPLASLAGLDILKNWGNAVNAAIATTAVLNVVEPYSTGIGGDAFALLYLPEEDKVIGLNANGRSPYAAEASTLREPLKSEGKDTIEGIYSVTVPGAFDGWVTLLEEHGTKSLAEVLESAIYYAEQGFPVTEIIAQDWAAYEQVLKAIPSSAETWLVEGNAPVIGELFTNNDLAQTFRKLAAGGRDEFYKGSIARAIANFSDEQAGFLSMRDFKDHTSTWIEPTYNEYKDYRLYELPPNGQGIAALEMLNILGNVKLQSMEYNSADYLHYLIEAKKLSYADLSQWVGDHEFNLLPIEHIISKEYSANQFKRINREQAAIGVKSGIPPDGDTVYLTVIDNNGNTVSFINSIYEKFGSKLTVPGIGILLQNRDELFSLQEGHVNVLEPHKRPFHTIIPATALKDSDFFMSFWVMGGSNQPQAHVQVLLNMIEYRLNVQEAIEAPRIRHCNDTYVMFEPGILEEVIADLEKRGHDSLPYRFGSHGGGQGIVFDNKSGSMFGGSDPRKNGIVVGY